MREKVKWNVGMVLRRAERWRDISVSGGVIMKEWRQGYGGGKGGGIENYSHMEMLRLDRSVRDWKNDKCVGQSIRSCQADGKLESGVPLRQIDTIRSTKMNSRWRVCVCVYVRARVCDTQKTNSQITTHTYGEGGEEDVRNGNEK